MISRIKGTIEDLKPTDVVIYAQGVGYGLSIPLSTYEKIQSCSEAALYVHTYHREDQLRLFGFFTEDERSLFVMLLNINGIGPSMALSILSGISIGDLVEAVRSDDTELLTKIPGIGKAKAEKLIFDLKRRLKKMESFTGVSHRPRALYHDAIEALVTLGYDEAKSSRIVEEIVKRDNAASVEDIIKNALKQLSA